VTSPRNEAALEDLRARVESDTDFGEMTGVEFGSSGRVAAVDVL
jgi:hypothetical protein